jgi:hypothetical protein
MKLALYLPNFRDKISIDEIDELAKNLNLIRFGLLTVSSFPNHPIEVS